MRSASSADRVRRHAAAAGVGGVEVDLDQAAQHAVGRLGAPRPAIAPAWRGRRCGRRRRTARRRRPCWSAVRRGSASCTRAATSACLSPASGWRFSPTSVMPSSASSSTSEAGYVLVTAIRVISLRSRPAASHAAWMRCSVSASPAAISSRRRSSQHHDASEATGRRALAPVGEQSFVLDRAGVGTDVGDLDAQIRQLRDHPGADVDRRRAPRGGGPGAGHRSIDVVGHLLGHLVAAATGAGAHPRPSAAAPGRAAPRRRPGPRRRPARRGRRAQRRRARRRSSASSTGTQSATRTSTATPELVGHQRVDRPARCRSRRPDVVGLGDVGAVHLRHRVRAVDAQRLGERGVVAHHDVAGRRRSSCRGSARRTGPRCGRRGGR